MRRRSGVLLNEWDKTLVYSQSVERATQRRPA
jgi:hypothetical protein